MVYIAFLLVLGVGVGEFPSGTFRFKKIDGSFWNGETFRGLYISAETHYHFGRSVIAFPRKCNCVSAEMHIHFRRNGIRFAPNYDWLEVLNM